jgi:hypothetical protein
VNLKKFTQKPLFSVIFETWRWKDEEFKPLGRKLAVPLELKREDF